MCVVYVVRVGACARVCAFICALEPHTSALWCLFFALLAAAAAAVRIMSSVPHRPSSSGLCGSHGATTLARQNSPFRRDHERCTTLCARVRVMMPMGYEHIISRARCKDAAKAHRAIHKHHTQFLGILKAIAQSRLQQQQRHNNSRTTAPALQPLVIATATVPLCGTYVCGVRKTFMHALKP